MINKKWCKVLACLVIPLIVVFPFQMAMMYIKSEFLDPGFQGGVTFWNIFVLRWGYPFLKVATIVLPMCWVLEEKKFSDPIQNVVAFVAPCIYLVIIIAAFYSISLEIYQFVGSVYIPISVFLTYAVKSILVFRKLDET